MTSSPAPNRSAHRALLCLFLGGPALLFIALSALLASFFWPGGDLRALRSAAVGAAPGAWEKTVELNIGRGTFGLARWVSSFIPEIPPEAHSLLKTMKKAEVSVYAATRGNPSRAELVKAADHAMDQRGWEKAFGMVAEEQTVAIYFPRNSSDPAKIQAAVLVYHEGQLVCVNGRADLFPLLDLARRLGTEKKILAGL